MDCLAAQCTALKPPDNRYNSEVENRLTARVFVLPHCRQPHQDTHIYPNRSFGEKEDENIGKLLGRAEKRKEELERAGIHAEVLHEEPFTTAKDTLDFHVYVMQLKKGVINRKVLIEEISE